MEKLMGVLGKLGVEEHEVVEMIYMYLFEYGEDDKLFNAIFNQYYKREE